jgi:hypothetical protein
MDTKSNSSYFYPSLKAVGGVFPAREDNIELRRTERMRETRKRSTTESPALMPGRTSYITRNFHVVLRHLERMKK